jgi:4-amino-4-deoxy-L-arabinose transferase-like glycosyltransferase
MTVSESTTSSTDARRASLYRPRLISVLTLGKSAAIGLWRGSQKHPVWERPTLLVLLMSNAMLYFSNLGVNGWANSFYSAAAQAGTKDWSAFFFGSSDWGNSITVDKPPLSLWIMGVSAKLFGLSPESILMPQATIGVLTTLMLYVLVRRNFSAAAALATSAVFFTTPIVTLLSRYNNPDPLMLLLMVCGAYCVVRAVESGLLRHFVWAAVLLGLAFMTKQLQAMVSLPALGMAFIFCSPIPLRKRIHHGLIGLGALAISGGAWMTVVDLVPANARPYIGGSTTNSVLQLTLAYNGLNRIVPAAKDPTVDLIPAQYRTVENDEGFFRLFNGNFAQEASWLLIVALVSCVLVMLAWRRLGDSPARKATVVICGVWFMTAYLMLSFMGDGIHTYYTAMLAPPLALVIGLGIDALLGMRSRLKARLLAAGCALVGTLVAWSLLSTVQGWSPALAATILALGLTGSALLAVPPPTQWLNFVACAAICAGLLGAPLATSVYTASISHSGSNPLSGPVSQSPITISRFLERVSQNEPTWAYDIGFGYDPGPKLVELTRSTSNCKWAAATYPSQSAAKLQLASSKPIMPIGGFAGVDPSPTLDRFQELVDHGDICYLVWHQNHLELPGRSPALVEISAWVQSTFSSTVVDGATVYDLRRPKSL